MKSEKLIVLSYPTFKNPLIGHLNVGYLILLIVNFNYKLFQRCTRFIQLPQSRPIRAERIPKKEATKQAIAQF